MASPRVLGPHDGHLAILGGTGASFVLEGSIGALLGDSVVIGNPGDLIFKPREQWHTFWNPGDAPARVLEIISPAGFENYFRELGAELISGPPDPQRLAALCAQYALDMDMSSVPSLVQRFGVCFPGAPSPARIDLAFRSVDMSPVVEVNRDDAPPEG
jgi:cupin domain